MCQAALIGLLEACRESDGVSGRFAGIARLRVGWRVAAMRRAAAANKQRILTEAARDGDGRDGALARVAAPASTDPARVVELREELRERLREQPTAVHRAFAPREHGRRRYGQEQIGRALQMIADGGTIGEAAVAVGARYRTVHDWLCEARADSPAGRALAARRARAPAGNLSRRFSDEQKRHAVAMVANGSSLRAAAAAVGATSPAVLRWLRRAA